MVRVSKPPPEGVEYSMINRKVQSTELLTNSSQQKQWTTLFQICLWCSVSHFILSLHEFQDVRSCRTHYTPKDKDNAGVIPTGEIVSIKDTPFDFSGGKLVGKDYEKLQGGYDHNFVLFGKSAGVKDVRLSRAKEK